VRPNGSIQTIHMCGCGRGFESHGEPIIFSSLGYIFFAEVWIYIVLKFV